MLLSVLLKVMMFVWLILRCVYSCVRLVVLVMFLVMILMNGVLERVVLKLVSLSECSVLNRVMGVSLGCWIMSFRLGVVSICFRGILFIVVGLCLWLDRVVIVVYFFWVMKFFLFFCIFVNSRLGMFVLSVLVSVWIVLDGSFLVNSICLLLRFIV